MSHSMQLLERNTQQSAPRARWVLIATILGLFVAFNAILVWYHKFRPQTAVVPDYRKVAPDIDARIENMQLKPLRTESPQQSVRNLSDVGMFFWPGLPAESDLLWMQPEFPLYPSIGVRDVGFVASNRRVLKVLDELAKLPPDEAARLVTKEIERSLREYRELFDDQVEAIFSPEAKKLLKYEDPSQPVCWGYQTSSNDDGTPTLLGERYKLLALTLCAGNLGLEKCRPILLKVARQAKKDYQRLRRYECPLELQRSVEPKDVVRSKDCHVAWSTIVEVSLYNRQILGAGLLGTTPKLGGLGGAKRFKLEVKSLTLPLYDVQATAFDLHGRIGVVPVDYSQGELTLRYLGDTDDAAFDALLAAVEKADKKSRKDK